MFKPMSALGVNIRLQRFNVLDTRVYDSEVCDYCCDMCVKLAIKGSGIAYPLARKSQWSLLDCRVHRATT